MAFKTYRQVLPELPVDELLQNFLERFDLSIPEEIEYSDKIDRKASFAIAALIDKMENRDKREKLDSDLVSLLDFKSRVANKSIYDAIARERNAEEIRTALDPLISSIHRAFWLLLNSPKVLKRAETFFSFDRQQSVCSHLKFEEGLIPEITEPNKLAFQKDLSEYYVRNQSCGKKVDLEITERSTSRWHFHIQIRGRLEKEDVYDEQDAIISKENRHPLCVAFEFSSDTGEIEITERNAKLRNVIVKAFAKHYLKLDIDPSSLPVPGLNLGCLLADTLESSHANEYALEGIQVLRMQFLDEDDGADFIVTSKSKDGESVFSKLNRKFNGNIEAFTEDATIVSAIIRFYPGKWLCSFSSKEPFNVVLKKNGDIGWGKLSATEKDKVRDILADLGVTDRPSTDYDQAWELLRTLSRPGSSIRNSEIKRRFPDAFEYMKKHNAIGIGRDSSNIFTCPVCGADAELAESDVEGPVCRCLDCFIETPLKREDLFVWTMKREWLLLSIATAFGISPKRHKSDPITVLGEFNRHKIVVAYDVDLIAHNSEELAKLCEAGLSEPWVIAPAKQDCSPAGFKFIPFEDSFTFDGKGLLYRHHTLDGILPTDERFPVNGGFNHNYMWYTDKNTGKQTAMTDTTARIFAYMDKMIEPESVGDILRGAGLEGSSFNQYFRQRTDSEKARRGVFDSIVVKTKDSEYCLVNK